MKELAPPLLLTAHRDLGRFHQQEAQQHITLLADVSQSTTISAGLFRRNQPDVAGQLLAAVKALRCSDHQFVGQCGQRSDSGCVISNRVTGRFSTSSSNACVSSWISALVVSKSSRSWRRRLAHGANTIDSSSMRPAGRTALSYAAALRSVPPHATDSSRACASAPVDADATAVVANRDSLRPAPGSAESGFPSTIAV